MAAGRVIQVLVGILYYLVITCIAWRIGILYRTNRRHSMEVSFIERLTYERPYFS